MVFHFGKLCFPFSPFHLLPNLASNSFNFITFSLPPSYLFNSDSNASVVDFTPTHFLQREHRPVYVCESKLLKGLIYKINN